MSQTTTIDHLEVIYESVTQASITITGSSMAICEVLQKINDNQIKLK
jgi:hypothetical protein